MKSNKRSVTLLVLSWAVKLYVAIMLLQSMYYKIIEVADWVFLFAELGMEPYGRWVVAIYEFIAALLLLIPSKAWSGAVLTMSLTGVAIVLHSTVLGIDFRDDGGSQFYLSILLFVSGVLILYLRKGLLKR